MIQELNTEQKQRLNLSLRAQDVLETDREQFAPQLTKSGFINELLYRFAPQAGASITQTLERKRQTILLQLENLKLQKKGSFRQQRKPQRRRESSFGSRHRIRKKRRAALTFEYTGSSPMTPGCSTTSWGVPCAKAVLSQKSAFRPSEFPALWT